MPLHDVSAFALGDPLAGLVDGGDLFIQSPLADPEAIWASIPAPARAELRRPPHPGHRARHGRPRPPARAPPRTSSIRMQGVALVGVFLRVSPFAERAGLDRDALLMPPSGTGSAGSSASAAARVVDANLAVIAAAYDGLIDVTAPRSAGRRRARVRSRSREPEGAVR